MNRPLRLRNWIGAIVAVMMLRLMTVSAVIGILAMIGLVLFGVHWWHDREDAARDREEARL